MKITAQDLVGLGIVDRIVGEPAGGPDRCPRRAGRDSAMVAFVRTGLLLTEPR